jgi:Glutathione S-transferase, N-terminal domain
MKIYNSSTAPNPRRVRVFLAEKGIQVPYEEVDIARAVNRGPEFRKKNPLATVPVLELDGHLYLGERSDMQVFRTASSKCPAIRRRREGSGDRGNVESANRIRRAPANRRRV